MTQNYFWITIDSYELLFISLTKQGYVCGSVCLSVSLPFCLFVSEQHYSTSYERIAMKFYGEVKGGTRKNSLN